MTKEQPKTVREFVPELIDDQWRDAVRAELKAAKGNGIIAMVRATRKYPELAAQVKGRQPRGGLDTQGA